MRILILGGRAPVALDHARRFAAHGATVHVADSIACRISGASRAVTATVPLPPPRQHSLAFAAALAAAIRRQRIDLVLPTCEEVFYVSRLRARLPSECNVFVAPFELLRTLHSKFEFLAHARGLGVSVPDSARVASLEEAREWARDRPVVLKPEYSRFGVHVRLYPDGIPPAARPLAALGPWVVQAFETGREICSYSVASRGELRAHVAYEPRYRLARSSSYYFEPVTASSIERFCARFVAATGYTGQLSFDWIVAADGTATVLECNPRAISGVHLFDRHARLPAAIAGELVPRIPPSRSPRMIAAIMLGAGLPAALRAGTLARWRDDWNRATDVLAEPGDRGPLVGAVCDLASYVTLALEQRCTPREAATRDIEWDGEPLPE
jgi:hypothetical protein